jgi:anti-sigma B factor antagonist
MACTKDLVDVRVDRPAVGLVVVKVSGEVDILAAPTLRRCLDETVPAADSLVLDLGDTTFFGAAGLSVLVHAASLADRFGTRWAFAASAAVLRPLRVTNLDRELPVCLDFASALRLVATSPALY